MSEKTITRGERLTLMAYLAAPLLVMTVAVYAEGATSSGLMVMRVLTGLTAVMCGLLCTARAEGLAGWLAVPVRAVLFVLTCWAVLAFTFPGAVCLITFSLSFVLWLTMVVCFIHEMA